MLKNREKNIDFILRWIRIFLIVITVGFSAYLSAKLFPYLFPLLLGMLLAESAMFISSKLKALPFFSSKSPLKRRDGDRFAVFIYFLIVIALITLLVLAITAGTVQIRNFVFNLSENLSKTSLTDIFDSALDKIQDPTLQNSVRSSLETYSQKISEAAPAILSFTLNTITEIANGFPLFFLVFAVSLMSGYYSINGIRGIYASSVRVTGNKDLIRKLFSITSTVINTIFRIVGGYFLLMLITFFECYIGLLIFGVKDAWIWALITAIIDVLPILGSSVALIPISIYLAIQGLTFQAIGVLFVLMMIMILRRMWEPIILGSVMKLHPLGTIFSMLLGILFWGLSGVILGPLYLVTSREFLNVFQLSDKFRKLISKKSEVNSTQENLEQD